MNDVLTARERAKYTKVWADDRYRKIAPGMFEVEEAFRQMGCKPDETLNDYGCGTGRAARWFQDHGLIVTGVDLAENACEEDVNVVHTALWDLSLVDESYYAFCTDVMEHIPPERVGDVLSEIRDKTDRAAWFRIATRPDAMGPLLLGEPLHLTVQPAWWWFDALLEHWTFVTRITETGRDAVFLCRP